MNVGIIGSSFSAMAAAHALLARGVNVTVLDVGEGLEKRRVEAVAKLRDLPASEWPPDLLALIDENPTLGRHRLPKKVHFGSEYIYAKDRSFARLSAVGRRAPYPTFAKGGYSNIWGAAVLPPDACDMTDWPVSRSEMEPYFRSISALIPISGGAGTLDASFPAYKTPLGDIDPGPQGDSLLRDLDGAASRVNTDDLLYGRARLAIYTEEAPGALPCNSCGYCFTGCVRGSIFSTEPWLDEFARQRKIRYVSGLFVERISEEDNAVVVKAIDVASSSRSEFRFDSVFIGCGPLGTARLLLQSRDLYDQELELKESQKFVVPMLRLESAETAAERPSVTMASVFIELRDQELSQHWTHVQVIPMNPLLLRSAPLPAVQTKVGSIFYKPLLRRLMMAWCGMHSDHSSKVAVTLRKQNDDAGPVLEIRPEFKPSARAAAHRMAKRMFTEGLKFKTAFAYPFIQFSEPGSGTHCGGSFPMRAAPRDRFDTDTLGRPFGWKRTYVLDASILPSIPGTTLVYPVMANAYRIATLAPVA